jgi:hypothetical protein
MDPIGFALENWDAVGRWREREMEQWVDASGTMSDGAEIHGLDELESSIAARPEIFAQTLTEMLLMFAIGRGLESSDGPHVRKIVAQSAEEGYRFHSLIRAITLSKPFQMRAVSE